MRNILDSLGDADAPLEALYQDDPKKIVRLDAMSPRRLGTRAYLDSIEQDLREERVPTW